MNDNEMYVWVMDNMDKVTPEAVREVIRWRQSGRITADVAEKTLTGGGVRPDTEEGGGVL